MSRADAGEKAPMSGRGRCVKWGGAPGITAHRQSALRLLCPILFACAGRRDRWPLWRAIGPLARTQARRGSEERGGLCGGGGGGASGWKKVVEDRVRRNRRDNGLRAVCGRCGKSLRWLHGWREGVAWLEGGGGCRSRASSPLHLRLNMSPAAAVSYLQTKQLFFPSLLSPRYVRRSGERLIISYFQQLLHSGRGKADLGSLLLVVLFVCPRCCGGGVMDGAPDEARLLIG